MSSFATLVSTLAPNTQFHQRRYGELLAEVIQTEDRWLDIGAGTQIHNSFTNPTPMELRARVSSLVGVDLEANHLSRNRELDGRVCATGYELPFATGSFTLVTANMVIEHLEKPLDFFLEVSRVLAPGGRFVFVTPNRMHPVVFTASVVLHPRIRLRLAKRLEGRAAEHIFPTWYRANTEGALQRVARAAGLSIERQEVFQSIPFIQRPLVLTAIECLMIRLLSLKPLRGLGSNLIGVHRKQPQ